MGKTIDVELMQVAHLDTITHQKYVEVKDGPQNTKSFININFKRTNKIQNDGTNHKGK